MEELFTNHAADTVISDRILYTASTFARSSLLNIQEIGELEAKKVHTSSRVNLQSYLFFMVISGSGRFLYDGNEYELKKNSVVFIDCRKPYSHTTDADNLWTLRWCHFYGPSMPLIYEKYMERGGKVKFTLDSLDEMNSVWEKLMDTVKGDSYVRDMLINEELSALVRLLMEHSWHPEDRTSQGKRASVSEIREYLDAHYNEKISLDDLVEKFFISKYYLTHVFKEQYGQTIKNYLLYVRITHAKQMLRFSDKSVEEIGYECGFGPLHYFSRVFKEVEGVSPVTYRKQW